MEIDNVEDMFIILESLKTMKYFIEKNKRKLRHHDNTFEMLVSIDELIDRFENNKELKEALKEAGEA